MEGGESNADADAIDEVFANLGAVIMGKTMFVTGRRPWGDDAALPRSGVRPAARSLTSRSRSTAERRSRSCTKGIEHALELAQNAAGDKDV
jgi:hypothetical protein